MFKYLTPMPYPAAVIIPAASRVRRAGVRAMEHGRDSVPKQPPTRALVLHIVQAGQALDRTIPPGQSNTQPPIRIIRDRLSQSRVLYRGMRRICRTDQPQISLLSTGQQVGALRVEVVTRCVDMVVGAMPAEAAWERSEVPNLTAGRRRQAIGVEQASADKVTAPPAAGAVRVALGEAAAVEAALAEEADVEVVAVADEAGRDSRLLGRGIPYPNTA
jgi:hypothetical protein